MTYNDFLYEGYWWLSLIGGLHCIGLGLYIRHVYRDKHDNHKLLGAIFNLLALYFLTGLISKTNSPVPLPMLFILIIPVYFLQMPLLYLYCYRSLHNIHRDIRMSGHFYPALALMVVISLAFVLDANVYLNLSDDPITNLSHVTVLGAVLPALLSLQALIYFYLIIKLLNQFRGRSRRVHQDSLKDIKFRWLLVLTLAMLINWVVRTGLVILPFYFGDHVSITAQAITRLCLLLTVYVLALYGLKQITLAAYLRGRLSSKMTDPTQRPSSQQLLNAEELNYLQQILNADDTQDNPANKP